MAEQDYAYPRARIFALVMAALVAVGGTLALLGWLLNIPLLKSGILGVVSMNPITALSFVAAAGALALLVDQREKSLARRTAKALAILVTTVGLLVLGRYLTPWDCGVDLILFREQLNGNQMAPNTAFLFSLVGLSLLLLDVRNPRLKQLSQTLPIIVVIGSSMSLVGYGYGARNLYGIGSYIPMAFNSAALFALTSAGLLAARHDRTVFAILVAGDAGGSVARWLLPAAIIIPLILGLLRVVGQRAGLYDTEFGAALMVVVTVTLLVAAILITASALSRADAQRRQAEATIQFYADIVRQIPIGLNIWRLETPDDPRSLRFVNSNPAAAALLGVDTGMLLGRTILEAFPEVAKTDLATYADVAHDGQCREIPELLYGDERVAPQVWSVKAFPLPDCCVGLAFENITRRKEAEQQIRRLNQELEQRVEERTADLVQVNRDLAQKNQENEMFVYSVSHDLRSPLVSLQGFSKELGLVAQELRSVLSTETIPEEIRARVHGLLDSDVHESLKFIQSGVLRLSNIIDALLRLSRVGRIEYEFRQLDTSAIVRRVVESISGELFEKGVNIRLGELPPCYGDATAVEQLFANLIGNALKYLDAGRTGEIEIGMVTSPPGEAGNSAAGRTYFVRDNGLGIPAAYQEKIFQAFQRVHPKHAPGEGMGLAIVRRVVQRHGGRVWVDSTEGRGSTFFIFLPNPNAAGGAPSAQERSLEKAHSNGERTNGHLVGGRR